MKVPEAVEISTGSLYHTDRVNKKYVSIMISNYFDLLSRRRRLKNIARIANAVHCHSLLLSNKNCHEFSFSTVRIIISVSNVTSLQDCLVPCLSISLIKCLKGHKSQDHSLRAFSKCRCLCHCHCLCICDLLRFLNSFHHKLSEYVWL